MSAPVMKRLVYQSELSGQNYMFEIVVFKTRLDL